MLIEIFGSGQMTSHVGVCGETITVKWQPAADVPTASITLQTTVFVPMGKVEPLGGEQTTE